VVQDEDRKMKGTIRPTSRQARCPRCHQKFLHIPKLGYGCPKCKTVPFRFYIDIFWNGQRIRVCSDKTGQALDTYQRAVNLQARIQYEIDNHIFEPSKYVAGDIKKVLFENLFQEWYTTKEQDGCSPSYLPKSEQYSGDYFTFFKGDDVREIKKPHIHKFYYGLPKHLKSKTKKNIMATLKAFFNWLFTMNK
jgi:hypothetical protein